MAAGCTRPTGSTGSICKVWLFSPSSECIAGAGMAHKRNISALLLAGDRGGVDAVAARSGVPCKALAPLAGVPMIMRVLDALQASARIDSFVICGPGP